MPRGNDAEAHREFASQYGAHQSAEELLEAHRASMSPVVRATSLKALDTEATEGLDLASIKPSQGGTVLSAAVRGGQILYVAEGPDGRAYKDVTPYNG